MRLRATAVVLHNDKLLTFQAIDPFNHREYYFLPGGKIEGDETAPDCAIRETLEETGYKIQVDTNSAIDKEYVFGWQGIDHECLTIFYRGHLVNPLQQPEAVNDASYNKKVVWIPRQQIPEFLNYHPVILEATLRLCEL